MIKSYIILLLLLLGLIILMTSIATDSPKWTAICGIAIVLIGVTAAIVGSRIENSINNDEVKQSQAKEFNNE